MKHIYTEKPVTPFGGFIQLKKLLDKSKILEKIEEIGLPSSTSNNSIKSIDIVNSFFVSIWIGCFKFSHTAVVRLDAVLKEVFGWERVPSGTTYTRFFQKFTNNFNRDFFVKFNGWFFNQIRFDNFTLDVDSSVITRYGNQDGALKGYNPKKPGRNSHHPLFAFVSDLRMVANCWNRSGNTSSSNNCIQFLEETFEILKGKKVGLFRADSGFCTPAILSFLELKKIPYVMSCKLYAHLQWLIYNINKWNNIGVGLWITESMYKQAGWDKEKRVIIIRMDTEVKSKTTGKYLKSLFKKLDKEKVYKKTYHVFVTNQDLPAVEIWEQYKRRADAENRIKELKEDFGVGGFSMNNFWATEAAMRFCTIAYNIMGLYKQVTSQTQPSPTLRTLTFNCFAVGSWVVKNGTNKVLKMSVPLKKRQWFDGLFSKIENKKFPISLTG